MLLLSVLDTAKTMLVHIKSVTKKYSVAECECDILEEPVSKTSTPTTDFNIGGTPSNQKERDSRLHKLDTSGNELHSILDYKLEEFGKDHSGDISLDKRQMNRGHYVGIGSADGERERSGRVVMVLFSGAIACKIKAGCVVRIYPPW